jgi:hypothetical protein
MSLADPAKNSLPTQQIVRRLITSRQPEREGSNGRARVSADACDDLYRDLSQWVGLDGTHALFTRALTEARTESDALDQIQLRRGVKPYVHGVAESITSSGDAPTAEALEAMIVHVVELLGRLIGDDMATKLIELSIAAPKGGNAAPDDRREEA